MSPADPAAVEVAVCRAGDLPPGTMRRVDAAGRAVCVGNDGGDLFAIEDGCLHKGSSLAGGMLRDGKVTCPGHWWRYEVRTGRLAGHPVAAVRSFPIRADDGHVVVAVPPAEPELSWRQALLRAAHAEPPVHGLIWDIGGIIYPTPFEVFGQLEDERGIQAAGLPREPVRQHLTQLRPVLEREVGQGLSGAVPAPGGAARRWHLEREVRRAAVPGPLRAGPRAAASQATLGWSSSGKPPSAGRPPPSR